MIGRVEATVGDAATSTEAGTERRRARHSGDWVRVVAGLVVVAITSVLARQEALTAFEDNTFHLFNQLPHAFHSFFATVQQAGAFPAVLVVTLGALVLRRPRLAATFAVAGTAAWFFAKLVKETVGRPRPFLVFSDTVVRGAPAEGLGFPSGHSAVAAALATVICPYLPRWGRRAVWVVVLLVGIARMYVGAHLPLDIVGGFALGWAVGAGANLVVGTPPRRADLGALGRLFANHGLTAVSIEPLATDATGPRPYVVRTDDGRMLFAKLVSNEERDADALFKGWRHLTYRGIEDELPFLSPRRIVEHEAFMSLLAERGRGSTPRVLLAGPLSDGVAALGEELIEGRALDRMAPADISDETLTACWEELAKLRVARIAHRDLRLGNLMVDGDGRVWVLDFNYAEAEASDRALARDVAELLAALATVIGVSRPARTAVAVLGADAVASALPLLQPLALSKGTRRACRHHKGLLDDLRREVAATAGVDQAAPEHLPRVRMRSLVLLLLLGTAIYLVVPRLGRLAPAWDTLIHADLGWMAAALLASALSYVAAAFQLQGAVPDRLNLVHTIEGAVASSFANRVTPAGVGGVATNVRYLERCGFELPEAGSYVALRSAVGFIVHMAALIVTGLLVGSRADSVSWPPLWIVLCAAGLVLALVGVVLVVPPVRRVVVPHVHKVIMGLRRVATQPTRLAGLVLGASAVTGLYILALDMSLRAVGVNLSLSEAAVVYLGSAVVANAVPIPGGIGVMDVALTAGVTAFGVSAGPALAGALCFRLVTFWLPIVPGFVAMRHMHRHGLL